MKSWKRSIRSTNYCHSLLRVERGSGRWNSGLRDDSWWWNDNSIYSRTNNLSLSPSHSSLSHPPPFFLSLDLFVSFLPTLAIIFVLRLSLFRPEETGAGIVPTPPFLHSHLFQFVMLCSSLSVQGGGWVAEERVGRSEERWAKKLVSPLLP